MRLSCQPHAPFVLTQAESRRQNPIYEDSFIIILTIAIYIWQVIHFQHVLPPEFCMDKFVSAWPDFTSLMKLDHPNYPLYVTLQLSTHFTPG
jgi:hypothetical protein